MMMMTIKMRTMVHDISGDFEDHTSMTITGPPQTVHTPNVQRQMVSLTPTLTSNPNP